MKKTDRPARVQDWPPLHELHTKERQVKMWAQPHKVNIRSHAWPTIH